MRNALLALLLLLTFAVSAEPKVEGIWLGTLDLGAKKLRIAVTIMRGGDALSGTLNSLDQNSGELPLTEVTFAEGTLAFALPTLSASYEGALAGDAISGTFRQRGLNLPLTFARVDEIPLPKRPQEPKKPYPYAEEEVTVTNGDVKLAGTLTLPRATPPFPAVVLISGSGPQDRDETIFGHKPFLVLADHLTRRGIAVLRVDDRGTGKSTGNRSASTTDDYAQDVLACVNFLKARKDIGKIGLIGHSEGGLIASLVATRSKDVAFIVMLGAPGLPGEELVMRQAETMARSIGANDDEIARLLELQRQVLGAAKETPDEQALRARLQEIMTGALAHLSAEEKTLFASMNEMVNAQIKRLSSPWYRWFLAYDPRPALREVRVPVLAINGAKDVQVAAKENLAAIAAAAPHAKTIELPDVNHLLQTAPTGALAEYATIEETIAPTALEAIATWIEGVVRSK